MCRATTALIVGISALIFTNVALANSTLQLTGNVCAVHDNLRAIPPQETLVGRLMVVDVADTVLHTAENVALARSGRNGDNCLIDFDIDFDEGLLRALLTENLYVVVEACYLLAGDDDDGDEDGDDDEGRAAADSCAFGDLAVVVVDEPIDTLLDDIVAFVLAAYEAECPAGSALKSVDLDGTPGFVCTDEFALDSELAAEALARAAADAAEESARTAADGQLAGDIAAEAGARAAADDGLQSQITQIQSANTSCPAGQFVAQIDLGGTPVLVCRAETMQQLQVSEVSDANTCLCTPQATVTVACCRVSSALGGGEDPIGCIVVGGSGISLTGSNCGTTNSTRTGSGSCNTTGPTASCPAGSVRTGCSPGTAVGQLACSGPGQALTCGGTVDHSISCDCTPNLLGCGIQCTDTDFGSSQTRTGTATTAQCLSVT